MTKPDRQVWQDALAYLRRHRPDLCRQWFDEIEPLGMDGVVFVAKVNNAVRRAYLRRECAGAFSEGLSASTGRLIAIRFVGADEAAQAGRPAPRKAPGPAGEDRAERDGQAALLHPDYGFENFVVGPENRVARAAALAVCDKPGQVYNPLFVYGGVGLGKTHLLQATCLRLLSRPVPPSVCFLPCEDLVAQLTDAMQAGEISRFAQRFDGVDVLAIDDIHVLARRETTQEHFFLVFNAFRQSGRQVILSADSPPREIRDLEARLVSRFESGLVVDILPPTYETRLGILKQKARMRGVDLPDDVAAYIAAQASSNVRQLEGAFHRVQMQAVADSRPIDLDLARKALEAAGQAARPEVSIDRIIDVVIAYYGVKQGAVESPSRQKSLVQVRQVCMYLARVLTRFSLQEIGAWFGRRHHTTILHACRTVERRRDADGEFSRVLLSLEERIRSSARAS